jgi:hypothetical protein
LHCVEKVDRIVYPKGGGLSLKSIAGACGGKESGKKKFQQSRREGGEESDKVKKYAIKS